jgi:biotin carboxyl carrier protein
MPAYEVLVNGKPRKIEVTRNGQNLFTARVDDRLVKIELSNEKIEAGRGFSIKVDGRSYKVDMPTIEWGKTLPMNVEGAAFKAALKTQARKTSLTAFEPVAASPVKRNGVGSQAVEGAVVAPMTGKVVSVRVKQGDQVKAGQTLCVVEAMKMENEIAAVKAGVVREVLVSEGSPVSEGEALFIVA